MFVARCIPPSGESASLENTGSQGIGYIVSLSFVAKIGAIIVYQIRTFSNLNIIKDCIIFYFFELLKEQQMQMFGQHNSMWPSRDIISLGYSNQ